MKRIYIALSMLIVTLFCSNVLSASATPLKELAGEHFIVRYTTSDTFAKEIVKRAEKYYASVAKDLGNTHANEQWRLEERCVITLFISRREYIAVTGGEESAFSHGHLLQRKIYSYMGQDGFIKRVLPHDIAHLMFADYLGIKRHAFLWLHEGLALRAEKMKHKRLLRHAKVAFEEQNYIPFDALMRMSQLRSSDAPGMVELFYAESLAIVTFLLEKYNRQHFIAFCRDLRDNRSIPQALERNYGKWGIVSIQHLEEKVKNYV